MDTQSRWILGALIALAAVLVVGVFVARPPSPFPELVTGSSELIDVALAHRQQRNVTLVIAQAAREGAGGDVPTLIAPRDLADLDTYDPDAFGGTEREAIADWLLERMVGGNLEYLEYNVSAPPNVIETATPVTYPLGVTRIGSGERYILYRGNRPGSVVLVEESLLPEEDSP